MDSTGEAEPLGRLTRSLARIGPRVLIGTLGTALLALGTSLGARPEQTDSSSSTADFIDVSLEAGIDFEHDNGATGDLLLPEITGAGGALLDYDNDGDLDLYAVQGASLRPTSTAGAARDRLYRNDLSTEGENRLRFTDVTDRSGIAAVGYGMGAATGDIDNDGWIDLYVTNLGSNQMLRNNGDGSFTDVTASTGTDDPGWSTSATLFDYDRDGWLDLYVTNYVDFAMSMRRECFSRGSARDYCNPNVYEPVPDRLFHNNGDGTFSDVSVASGITTAFGAGLGVLASDVNADGWIDLYVANDGNPNQLWINDGGRGFRDDALLAGVALNRTGQTEGGMGVDVGDVDGDGDDDLFVTNLDNESNTLYTNVGNGLFEDRTIEAGLLGPSFGLTGFGTRFFDYDNDGWLDLFVVNGAVRHLEAQVRTGDVYPLRQPNQLFRNDGRGRFIDATGSGGPAFQAREVSRGAAVGDLDNDGDQDVAVFNNRGRIQLLLNATDGRRHWLGIRVLEDRSSRDALQARVELVGHDGGSRWLRVHTDGSYCSASDPRVVFGLGGEGSSQTVRVHWSGGQVEEFRDLLVDRYWTLEPGRAPRAP